MGSFGRGCGTFAGSMCCTQCTSFLTTRSLYLLVLEQRSGRAETDAKYWLQLIRGYAGPAPVVVALNKSRGVERPLDRDLLEKNELCLSSSAKAFRDHAAVWKGLFLIFSCS
jgi:hypothetical protein